MQVRGARLGAHYGLSRGGEVCGGGKNGVGIASVCT